MASFSGPLRGRSGYIRNVYKAKVQREDEEVLFDVEANAFLPQQVRRMAGALVQVGLKKMTIESFADLLLRPAEGAANTALPPQGVCLMKVNYREFPPKGRRIMTNSTKLYKVKPSELRPDWHVIDVADKVLGRISSEIATILQGKRKVLSVS